MRALVPDRFRHAIASGSEYTAKHYTKERIGNGIVLAIGRLIDKDELTWDIATDNLSITPQGEKEAARIAWWWRCG